MARVLVGPISVTTPSVCGMTRPVTDALRTPAEVPRVKVPALWYVIVGAKRVTTVQVPPGGTDVPTVIEINPQTSIAE